MKAYQCSKCENLCDFEEQCNCSIGIDARTSHREKGDAALCKKNFTQIAEEKQWHEKFSWE